MSEQEFVSLPDGSVIPKAVYQSYVLGITDDELVRFLERKVVTSHHAVREYAPGQEKATLKRRQRLLDDVTKMPLDIDIDVEVGDIGTLRR